MGIISRTQRRLSLTFELVAVMLLLLLGGLAVTAYTTQRVVAGLQKDLREFAQQTLVETEETLRQQGERSAKQVVLDKSLHLNEVLAGVERIAHMEAEFAARLYRERLPGVRFPIYANDDFLDKNRRPPDFGPEPGRDREVSLESAVYKLAPRVSSAQASATVQRVRPLGYLFQQLYRTNPTAQWLYVGTSDGVYLGYPADGGFDADYDPRTRPWYVRAVKTGGLTWSEPYVDVLGGRLVTCSLPVFRPGTRKVGAVVAVDVTVGELGRLANEVEAGFSGGAFLLDRAGNVISAPTGDNTLDIVDTQNMLTETQGDLMTVALRMVAGESGLDLIQRENTQVYVAFAPITTTGWSLGVIIPLDEVLSLSVQQRKQLELQFAAMTVRIDRLKVQLWSSGALMILILIFLFAGGAYVRLTRPIQDVIRDLSIIRRGDLDHRVEVRGAQDFRNLSAAINQMTAHLKKSRLAIEEYSHTLERKVAERTKELARSNRELEETLLRLTETQSLLVHSEKMASLGQLVAGIAHEINNPVNFVANSVGPMREALDELDDAKDENRAELLEQIRKALQLIETGASRTKQIVLNLRNFSRLDEAELKLANLHEGLDSSLQLLNYQIKGRIDVVKEYGDIGALECNPGQLNQVFMNILANSCQAIDGNGEIRISTKRQNGEIEIRISDNGKGIENEVLSKIFDPFFTTKPVGTGTGLGLAITHGIIENHGGTINVTSEVGSGTEFTIRLPVER